MQGSGSKQDELGMPICPCKVYNGDQNWRNAASFVQQYLKENEEGVWCCHCWMQRISRKVWAITPVVLEVNKNPFMNDTSVHKFILAVLWTQLQFHNPFFIFFAAVCICTWVILPGFHLLHGLLLQLLVLISSHCTCLSHYLLRVDLKYHLHCWYCKH